ncbi:SAG-related sequence SRS10 [Caenorhabditis elegans]|uniref:SAG-related sequence SRS10 n=1 Tax=Caenorhabditis elegans TaxID=6239 RepID=H1ZUW5_CAEEL|nr:SAG-related sequence SRS10 [Caenorhabditis elegans]CCF23385.1 SAG-related sequence SRS10 [Caenorhabditis elegans]|eukprot:NP_001254049.1 Uncharacterized protein CELE_C33C12.12 [Caenorhabditis elegans]
MFFQYFDAELEIRLLKMTCDVLKDTGSKLVIFDDGAQNSLNQDSTKIACVKNDCILNGKQVEEICISESPPKTTTTPAPVPTTTTTEPSGASQLAALSSGLLILGVFLQLNSTSPDHF